jgi:A/G-specific adenine glycosylase
MSLKKLIQWSKKEFSHLPWRKKRTLYTTLVSEIMLQQTTVSTVQKHFARFINRFPSLEDLANASEEELLVAWKGLGYYRRARNLKKIAESLIHDHGGEFPNVESELRKIPGIGPYTSGALIGIGMDERALAVDANLERVISRLHGIEDQKGLKLQKKINLLFNENKILYEKDMSYRELNEALMDLGRVYCQARKVSCGLCPLSSHCEAFHRGNPLSFPHEKALDKKRSEDHVIQVLRLIVMKKDHILAYKKSEKEWLSGQFEVPTCLLSSTDKKLIQYPWLKQKVDWAGLPMFKTGITKYKIENYIQVISYQEFKTLQFPHPVEWRKYSSESSNLSTASIKAIQRLKKP